MNFKESLDSFQTDPDFELQPAKTSSSKRILPLSFNSSTSALSKEKSTNQPVTVIDLNQDDDDFEMQQAIAAIAVEDSRRKNSQNSIIKNSSRNGNNSKYFSIDVDAIMSDDHFQDSTSSAYARRNSYGDDELERIRREANRPDAIPSAVVVYDGAAAAAASSLVVSTTKQEQQRQQEQKQLQQQRDQHNQTHLNSVHKRRTQTMKYRTGQQRILRDPMEGNRPPTVIRSKHRPVDLNAALSPPPRQTQQLNSASRSAVSCICQCCKVRNKGYPGETCQMCHNGTYRAYSFDLDSGGGGGGVRGERGGGDGDAGSGTGSHNVDIEGEKERYQTLILKGSGTSKVMRRNPPASTVESVVDHSVEHQPQKQRQRSGYSSILGDVLVIEDGPGNGIKKSCAIVMEEDVPIPAKKIKIKGTESPYSAMHSRKKRD